MDYGDDPLISTTYGQENAGAVAMLKPAGAQRLEGLRNRCAWSKRTLDSLRDSMITPAMLLASGVKWDNMNRKHGTAALIQYGYRWPDMLSSGFRGNGLRTLTHGQLSQLGINAARALECRPRIGDISALGLGAEQLSDMGWTPEMLMAIGLNRNTMVDFGYPLKQWISVLGVKDFGALGFDTYANCATAGWSRGDIELAVRGSRPLETATAVCTAVRQTGSGEIKFI